MFGPSTSRQACPQDYRDLWDAFGVEESSLSAPLSSMIELCGTISWQDFALKTFAFRRYVYSICEPEGFEPAFLTRLKTILGVIRLGATWLSFLILLFCFVLFCFFVKWKTVKDFTALYKKMLLFEAAQSGINLGLTVMKKLIWGQNHHSMGHLHKCIFLCFFEVYIQSIKVLISLAAPNAGVLSSLSLYFSALQWLADGWTLPPLSLFVFCCILLPFKPLILQIWPMCWCHWTRHEIPFPCSSLYILCIIL